MSCKEHHTPDGDTFVERRQYGGYTGPAVTTVILRILTGSTFVAHFIHTL
ncbi:hypothetical protein [Methanococcoides seepicolus]|uniref:Uncharacterized protein n=1 Tax=Methanococcoides seepicolus TaxID=2828780 RepID=A0A9E4ZGQ0_9EURY|nr:hypothetical protein [Methanococcoides seepicolus]MCM1987585.1 hypothetical protein [Methanococcoides seepicolus]